MSTYSQVYLTAVLASSATFRARAKFFSDALTSMGWAKTADTGQIDLTSVSWPAGADTSAGYEIRKSNDGKSDIYAKIEYGTGHGTNTAFGFWITLGTGSDGAGTLTGLTTTRTQCSTSSPVAVTCADVACGNASHFMLAHMITTTMTANNPIILVQRTTDAAGVDDDRGFLMFTQDHAAMKNQYVSFSSGVQSQRTGWGWTLMGTSPVPATVTKTPVFPVVAALSDDFMYVRGALFVPTAYASAGGSTHSIYHMGATRNFAALAVSTAFSEGGTFPASCTHLLEMS